MLRALAIVLFIPTVGCGPDPDLECMVKTEGGACITVLSVQAHYFDGATSNVDAFRDTCQVPDPINSGSYMDVAEPFTDHMVAVEIANVVPTESQRVPGLAPTVTFDTSGITFALNDCVLDIINDGPSTCPPPKILDIDLDLGTVTSIPADATATIWLPLVPLRKKYAYSDQDGGQPGAYHSYTATITLGGDDHKERFTLVTHAEFTIGNFDLCGLLE